MAWALLIVASVLEMVWAIALKYAEGFTRLGPALLGIVAATASLALLTFALRSLPVGTAYAVWTGLGAAGVAVVGVLALGESASAYRLACIGLIVCGTVGLRFAQG